MTARINRSSLNQKARRQLRKSVPKVQLSVLPDDIFGNDGTTYADTSSDYLRAQLSAYKKYIVSLRLLVATSDNNGFKAKLTGPSEFYITGAYLKSGAFLQPYGRYSDEITTAAGSGNTRSDVWLDFYIQPIEDGVLVVQNAEHTNHSNQNTIYAGSYLRVEEIE